ncbi:alpha/beta hydrolase [Sphingosinicella rhizophila]|uniref:Alpha/beta fold hydrolase n=1 Tax=Sphingosinicella rhizophila TaxID=3050082 RepID=A0ABU3QA34_9SPHN|nr:alpha/beta fold hydrolase [Sphingosinicella sp. GR2756]MDT9600264.1 alpha/beta fold hydrolase [Sphingosinicella sp. GR2756]
MAAIRPKGNAVRSAAILFIGLLSLPACSSAPAPGRLVDVGGHKLHIACSGSRQAGRPTVVIDSGAGVTSPAYHWLQEGVSDTTRICSYDRAGIGWSETSDQSHDAVSAADQLHMLLERSGEHGPYIIAAHSIAGLYAHVFAARHPDSIAGLVLIDPSHPKQQAAFNTRLSPDQEDRADRMTRYLGFLAGTGLTRFYHPLFNMKMVASLPTDVKRQIEGLSHRADSYRSTYQEARAFDQSAREAIAAGPLGSIPLMVISAQSIATDGDPMSQQMAKFDAIKIGLHTDLLNLSTQSKHIVVAGAGHITLVLEKSHAAKVVAAIESLVLASRSGGWPDDRATTSGRDRAG